MLIQKKLQSKSDLLQEVEEKVIDMEKNKVAVIAAEKSFEKVAK